MSTYIISISSLIFLL